MGVIRLRVLKIPLLLVEQNVLALFLIECKYAIVIVETVFGPGHAKSGVRFEEGSHVLEEGQIFLVSVRRRLGQGLRVEVQIGWDLY